MNFPLNQLRLDPAYISAIEDEFEGTIRAQFHNFKKVSAALVKAFKKECDTHGSIEQLPKEILEKYNKPLTALFKEYSNLRVDLRRGVNKNSKYYEEIEEQKGADFIICKITLRKNEKLRERVVYYNAIQMLHVAIEVCLKSK